MQALCFCPIHTILRTKNTSNPLQHLRPPGSKALPISPYGTVDYCTPIQLIDEAVSMNVVDFEQARIAKEHEHRQSLLEFFQNQPPTLTPEQCTQGRGILNWSEEALAFRSGASVVAIRQFEAGNRPLKWVTKQALAFAMEAEGLLFIPGCAPGRGDNCRGSTPDPRLRDDFHLIE